MPVAYRSVICKEFATVTGTIEELEQLAEKAIGATLTARGWSLDTCFGPSTDGLAKVTFVRRNERNRGFYDTTEPQWTDIQRRFAALLSGCSGWYSDELPAVVATPKAVVVAAVAHPIASDEWRCCQCGIDNSNCSSSCMVCCSPKVAETAVATDDSELQRLLDAVETTQRNLRKFLASR